MGWSREALEVVTCVSSLLSKGVRLACSWRPSAGLTQARSPPAVTALGEAGWALRPLPPPGPGCELLQGLMQESGAGAPGPRLSAEHSLA